MHPKCSLRRAVELDPTYEVLFNQYTNTEIGKQYNISRETVRNLRLKFFPNSIHPLIILKNRRKKKVTIDISNYLHDYSNKVCINKFCKLYNYKNDISRQDFINISKELNIDIKFFTVSKYEHSVSKLKHKKCDCKICRLAWGLVCRFYKHNLIIKHEVANYYANNYLEKYLNDNSRYKQEFFLFVKNDLKNHNFKIFEKLGATQNVRTQTS